MLPKFSITSIIEKDENLKNDKELLYLIRKYRSTIKNSAPAFALYNNIDEYKSELKKEIEMFAKTGDFKGERVDINTIENDLFYKELFPDGELKYLKEMHIILFDEPAPQFDYKKNLFEGYYHANDVKKYIQQLRDKIELQVSKEKAETIDKKKNRRETIRKIVQNDKTINWYKKHIKQDSGSPAPEYDYDKYCYYEGIENYRKYLEKVKSFYHDLKVTEIANQLGITLECD